MGAIGTVPKPDAFTKASPPCLRRNRASLSRVCGPWEREEQAADERTHTVTGDIDDCGATSQGLGLGYRSVQLLSAL